MLLSFLQVQVSLLIPVGKLVLQYKRKVGSSYTHYIKTGINNRNDVCKQTIYTRCLVLISLSGVDSCLKEL